MYFSNSNRQKELLQTYLKDLHSFLEFADKLPKFPDVQTEYLREFRACFSYMIVMQSTAVVY